MSLEAFHILRITPSPAKGLGAFEPKAGRAPKGQAERSGWLGQRNAEEKPHPRWREQAFPSCSTYFTEGKTHPSRNLGSRPREDRKSLQRQADEGQVKGDVNGP